MDFSFQFYRKPDNCLYAEWYATEKSIIQLQDIEKIFCWKSWFHPWYDRSCGNVWGSKCGRNGSSYKEKTMSATTMRKIVNQNLCWKSESSLRGYDYEIHLKTVKIRTRWLFAFLFSFYIVLFRKPKRWIIVKCEIKIILFALELISWKWKD